MAPKWPVHPAAELFPLLDDAELAELVEDVRASGLHEPVWLWRDPERGELVLLDGRNRVRACELAGVAVETREFEVTDLDQHTTDSMSPERYARWLWSLREAHWRSGGCKSKAARLILARCLLPWVGTDDRVTSATRPVAQSGAVRRHA